MFSVPRARTEDDRIILGKFVHCGDGRLLVKFEAGLACTLLRHQFGNALDHGFRAGLAHAFGHGFRHPLDVTVGRIVEYENLCHLLLLWFRCGDHAPAASCVFRLS